MPQKEPFLLNMPENTLQTSNTLRLIKTFRIRDAQFNQFERERGIVSIS